MVNNHTYLQLFLDDLRKQVSLSEFEKHFKVPHQTIKAHLSQLVKSRILNETKKARFRLYSLNLSNPLLIHHLSICEKERFFEFIKKPTFFSLYDHIYMHSQTPMLIFGSSVISDKFRDIDILIIGKNEGLRKALDNYEKIYGDKIHITQAEKNQLSYLIISEIRKKHILISEHDFFLRVLYKDDLELVQKQRDDID